MITDIVDYVAFRGDKLTLIWQGEEPYVAIRPICERLGLHITTQRARIQTPESGFSWALMRSTGQDGKSYEMLCLHAVDLPLWLASISPAKVKPEVREALMVYRAECKLVLFEHVKARLMGERDAATKALIRLRADLLAKKPGWARIEAMIRCGDDFPTIWRRMNQPRHRVAEAITDMQRVGLIAAPPAGMPAVQMQLFAEG